MPSDRKEKEKTLSSINHILKNFPILLPVFVLGQQIVYRNKTNLLYLFRRKCLLYHLLADTLLFIQKQQEKCFCIENSQGQEFLFLMLAASSLTSLTTIFKPVSDSNLIVSLQEEISQLQVAAVGTAQKISGQIWGSFTVSVIYVSTSNEVNQACWNWP